jgi:ELWxxDGT repeat protein
MDRLICTLIALSTTLPGLAQDVTVLDLNTDGIPSNAYTYLEPHAPTPDGRLAFRTGGDDGDELWFTDGWANGTFFEDLWRGNASSRPNSFTLVGSRLFFVASGPGTGAELWSTLGPGQAAMVADLAPGPLNSVVESLTAFGDDLFFTAFDLSSRGLYTVDSVSLSLTPVATDAVEPDRNSNIVDDNSRVYFKGRPPAGGPLEIWASDGTDAGTEQATDIGCPGWGELLGVGTIVFAVCDDGISTTLLRLDSGSPTGTTVVHDFGDQTVEQLTPSGGTLFMVVGDEQIWGLDSTTGVTSQVTGFGGGAAPDDLVSYRGDLVFAATGAFGRELFWTDGSTVTGIEISPGQASSDPAELRVHDGRVYFTADDGTNGRELWSTDGTTAGTSMVVDLEPGPSGSEIGIGPSTDLGLFFNRSDRGLWITDGTTAGTREITLPGSRSSSPTNLHVDAGSGLLFFVRDRGSDDGGKEPFVTDGTVDGTFPLGDLEPGPEGPDIEFRASLPNGRTLFTAYTTADETQLWSTQGLEDDARIVRYINPAAFEYGLRGEVFDGSFFFCANDGVNGNGLWRSDGTAAGTFTVVDLNPSSNVDPCDFAVFEGHLYFGADNGTDGGLWRTDGTAAGTELVAITAVGSTREPDDLTVSGGHLYFTADDGISGEEIWRSDGTAAGTELVADVNPGPDGSRLRDLVPAAGLLFFSAEDDVHGRELWRTDGTAAGTVLVGDMLAGPDDSDASPIAELAGGLVFEVRRPDNALYHTDGTPGSVTPILHADFINVSRFNPVWNGQLYFVARSHATDAEDLWRTDGTPAGTENLQLEPGDMGSNPRDLVACPEHLYLSAYDLMAKQEIHILTAPLFADGFETGDTSGWSTASP